jgi:hypothetical protein
MAMAKVQRPEITTLTAAQVDALLAELRPQVPAATYQLIAALLQTLQWLMADFEQKTISIARLKRMLFGHSTETTSKVFGPSLGPIRLPARLPAHPKPSVKVMAETEPKITRQPGS